MLGTRFGSAGYDGAILRSRTSSTASSWRLSFRRPRFHAELHLLAATEELDLERIADADLGEEAVGGVDALGVEVDDRQALQRQELVPDEHTALAVVLNRSMPSIIQPRGVILPSLTPMLGTRFRVGGPRRRLRLLRNILPVEVWPWLYIFNGTPTVSSGIASYA